MLTRYNHAFSICFTVESDSEDGSDVTPEMFRAGLLERVARLDSDDEWGEAHVEPPFDTYAVNG